ncbi:MAG: RNB domain-containing ribonuclease, partial [Pseudomonadota bacterium]
MKHFPSKDQVLEFIRDNPAKSTKRDIAKAFGIKGAARIELKRLLKDLAADGHIAKKRRTFRDPNVVPPVAVLVILGPDQDGDLFAEPAEWDGDISKPRILVQPGDGDPALGKGDQVLMRLTEVADQDHSHTGRLIRKIGSNPSRVLGIFRGDRIVPIDKGANKDWLVGEGDTLNAKNGELVEAEAIGSRSRMGLPRAKVVQVLGDPGAAKSVSLIAIHQHGIPVQFDDDVIAQVDTAKPATAQGRTDLTHLPLVTIDPSDARDHDDACCAIAQPGGGFTLWVAIADVAFYVTPGSPLDRAARDRGNSTYFPDRVVPMLPDVLSGDLCSLHEGVDRPCMAVEIEINAQGEKLSHRFHRGWMNSPAALSYEEAQDAVDGRPTDRAKDLVSPVLEPLFAAYRALKIARDARQPLELDLPERRIELTDDGHVKSVNFRDRFDAHKLIEEFMVLANVCAAETLIAKRQPLLFRVHEEPDRDKLESLRETAQSVGLSLAKGQVLQTRHLNQLLTQAAGKEEAELINISTLRSMSQAYYGPENLSH